MLYFLGQRKPTPPFSAAKSISKFSAIILSHSFYYSIIFLLISSLQLTPFDSNLLIAMIKIVLQYAPMQIGAIFVAYLILFNFTKKENSFYKFNISLSLPLTWLKSFLKPWQKSLGASFIFLFDRWSFF
ncbi:MAG: hypothetical protein A3F95_01040 [Candidatus Nealsonbacteria bacterium RIFCSPLOWO2_12_FULL_39_31]|uniref:Uncharacterized protein n=1 Tax=Candidatus Nealsonbacteria bacterium RIFCSPLOWO2_12_FULL_39_31 TaxID=1801676 RepID=A0A1G2EL47_9BACT|nr:MAG: hypothetical protein A3F95_01040 [Candidatus Nealsonbacteria bacterium RIFCSPLOWO2_12_FULL_39_31]